jgi:chorismate mutase
MGFIAKGPSALNLEAVVQKKQESKPKLTDAERHERFVAMAKEVGADNDPASFERVFQRIVRPIQKAARVQKK